MTTEELIAQIQPLILQILGILLTAFLGWIAAALSKGNQVAAKQANLATEETKRTQLNEALKTGARAVLSVTPNASLKDMVAGGIDYAKRTVPDALVEFQNNTDALSQKAHARALEVRQEAGLP